MNRQGKHPNERGQALVLIVFGIFVLFGFAALAVDGGQIFMARRGAQSAADSASMAAAYAASMGEKDVAKLEAIALAKAKANGYNNDGITNSVTFKNPPNGGAYCGTCGKPNATEYYQVRITVFLKPVFAQMVFKGAEQTKVESTAHAKTAGTLSQGDAILALSHDDDAILFDGNTGVAVTNGNMRSDGGITKKGGAGTVNVVAPGHVYYATTPPAFVNKVFVGAKPQQQAASLLSSVPEPYCPTASERATWPTVNGVKTKKIDGVNYFYYGGGLSTESLDPGIHCVDGGIGKGNYSGDHVLIVLLSGGIKQTGNDSFDLRSAHNMIDKNGKQWGGMVFYVPSSNTSELTFGGNSGAYFHGTIYAPGAYCDIGGTPDGIAENTSWICNKFKFHGNPTLNINFRAPELYQTPPTVEMVE